MTTTKEQLEQRAAEIDTSDVAPRLTRRDLARLAGVTEKTVRNWLAGDARFRASATQGPRRVELFPAKLAVQWVRNQLFPEDASQDLRSGPRLAVEPAPMPHPPGERWQFTDMAKIRAVTANSISKLAAAYAAHNTHPFPVREGDGKYDAAAVSNWFYWYDSVRPGYEAPRPAEKAATVENGRHAQVAQRVKDSVANGEDLTTEKLAEELGISPDVASRYLNRAAKEVMPKLGLLSRPQIAARLPGSMSPAQRRERVKTLMKRRDAPQPTVTIAGTTYFMKEDLFELLPPSALGDEH
ncbi:hypothetical protein [Streptomyces hygroscopicus]|uniref:hypothetical protein n=1 Tax=Streptomyces hygroscopicus TaxID=1912 RepID=UPI001FCC3F36|nr:hypothetical protein [Streptomyces hygroscopicus]BDH10485.1 hypothetical protein HOK021_16640 [Streptomyces hygroscopicus]